MARMQRILWHHLQEDVLSTIMRYLSWSTTDFDGSDNDCGGWARGYARGSCGQGRIRQPTSPTVMLRRHLPSPCSQPLTREPAPVIVTCRALLDPCWLLTSPRCHAVLAFACSRGNVLTRSTPPPPSSALQPLCCTIKRGAASPCQPALSLLTKNCHDAPILFLD